MEKDVQRGRGDMGRTPRSADQLGLFQDEEDPAFLTEQLITYIGNKRSLLRFIGEAMRRIEARLGRSSLDVLDLFSGSGVVARYLKRYARRLLVNDLEGYCSVINRCYLANRTEVDLRALGEVHRGLLERLDRGPLLPGLITRLYAPRDDAHIEPGERVFYTNRNARYLDTARRLIGEAPGELRPFLLAPLLSEASVHANTAGVFKGFYKDSATGIGMFGGRKRDALTRILGDITLPFPVLSRFACPVEVFAEDANRLARRLDEVDVAYLDPPYNQHPYGSNYFMLNLLVDYAEPEGVSPVSGIPAGWRRSTYNRRAGALGVLEDLVSTVKAKFLLISFNSEGFIEREEMISLLSRYGRVETLETDYYTFRGSRNLRARSAYLKEYLYLVERS